MKDLQIKLSLLDQKRFGVITAKFNNLNQENYNKSIAFCKQNNAELLIVRIKTEHLTFAQHLENENFRLMDTLVYYKFDLKKKERPKNTGKIPLRKAQPNEADKVREIAVQTFAGYYGHYHADPRLDPDKCDEVYVDWAYQSCVDKEVADKVLVPYIDDEIVGFATLRLNTQEEGEGVLFGVSPKAQRMGIYRSMILQGLEWCQEQQRTSMVVSTQVNNIAVQKVWSRVGFEAYKSYYTFHRWFN